MKVGLICDTHYGYKRGSKVFEEYFEKFYSNIFFPSLEEYQVDTVIHMGDCFDVRKTIDFNSLEWTKRVVLDPLSKYKVHLTVGNHDTYFKNTNHINSPELLLNSYSNIKTYSSPTEIKVGNLDILLLPWINSDNERKTFECIQKSSCKVAMGHLELQGFRVNRQLYMEHGYDSKLFKKFYKVFSGHYHTRSDDGRVFYLGNPYEMFSNDEKDLRGFTIFDTETLEHFHINNPYRMFYSFVYDEDNLQIGKEILECEDKIVKLVVKNKKDYKKFDKFVDNLYGLNPHEVKIVENFEIEELEDCEELESEDTLSILNKYISESEVDMDKYILKSLVQEIYQESHETI